MPTAVISPLAESVARVSALDQYLAAQVGPLEGDWFPAADLWDPNKPTLARGLALSIAEYPGAEWRAAGSFLVGHYSWYLAAAAIAAYLAESRVPDLRPDNVVIRTTVVVHEEEGETHEHASLEVRYLSGRFACLPGDPAAVDPDALVLPDLAALRDWLRLRLEQHMAPLIDAVYASTRLGKRAGWNLTADSCARLFQWAGHLLGDEERACAEGLAFVRAPGSPMRNQHTGYITLEHCGHRETFTTRGGCCLYYRVPGGERCHTCVLRPTAERDRLLLEQMARQHAEPAPA